MAIHNLKKNKGKHKMSMYLNPFFRNGYFGYVTCTLRYKIYRRDFYSQRVVFM